MRREEAADFLLRYPFLNEDPVYRPATKELFTTAQNSLAKRLHNIILQQNEVSFSLPYLLLTFMATRGRMDKYVYFLSNVSRLNLKRYTMTIFSESI